MKYMNVTWVFIVVVLIMFGYTLYKDFGQKTGWIELSKAYEGFQLKKDLEAKLIQFGNTQKNILDSIEVEVRIKGRKAKENPSFRTGFETDKAIYYERKMQYENQLRELKLTYDKQVLNQLRSLVKKFGNDNRYRYIYGMDDSGIFIYGKEGDNLTDEVVAFVNHEYNGTK